MKELRFLDELVQRYPVLEPIKGDILKAYEIMRDCYEKGGKLMIAGNGGSCSDSEHIVGELMKGFVKRRPVSAELAQALKAADPQMGEKLAENLQGGLPAIALTGHGYLPSSCMATLKKEMYSWELRLPAILKMCFMQQLQQKH